MDQQSGTIDAPMAPSRGLAFTRWVFGRLWLRGGLTAVLEVPGRRSGTTRSVLLFPIEVDGSWYLLSQYGVSGWVRNLRAAGRADLRRIHVRAGGVARPPRQRDLAEQDHRDGRRGGHK